MAIDTHEESVRAAERLNSLVGKPLFVDAFKQAKRNPAWLEDGRQVRQAAFWLDRHISAIPRENRRQVGNLVLLDAPFMALLRSHPHHNLLDTVLRELFPHFDFPAQWDIKANRAGVRRPMIARLIVARLIWDSNTAPNPPEKKVRRAFYNTLVNTTGRGGRYRGALQEIGRLDETLEILYDLAPDLRDKVLALRIETVELRHRNRPR